MILVGEVGHVSDLMSESTVNVTPVLPAPPNVPVPVQTAAAAAAPAAPIGPAPLWACDIPGCRYQVTAPPLNANAISSLLQHFNAVHIGLPSAIIDGVAVRCPHCGRAFRYMGFLRSHIDKVHPAHSTRRAYDAPEFTASIPNTEGLHDDDIPIGPLLSTRASLDTTVPEFHDLPGAPLGGVVRRRTYADLPAELCRPFIAKVQQISASIGRAYAADDVPALHNLLAHLIVLPVTTLSVVRGSRLHQRVATNIEAFTVDPNVNPLLDISSIPGAEVQHDVPAEQLPPGPEAPPRVTQSRSVTSLKSTLYTKGSIGTFLDRMVAPESSPLSSEDALAQLASLHPRAYSSNPLPVPSSASPLLSSVSLARVSKIVLKRLKRGASPGLDGWSQPLLSLVIGDTLCLRAISILVLEICNGAILDPGMRAALLGSRLVAVPKPGTDRVRPVAVGSVFLKLAAHVLLSPLTSALRRLFSPCQFGLFVPGGVEAALLRVQLSLESGGDDGVLVALDLTNAFNTRSRRVILDTLYSTPELSSLYRLVHWLYGAPTPLQFFHNKCHVATLWSEEGVRQGDVLGSVLFALSIQAALIRATTECPDVSIVAVHDDITLVGPVDAAFRSYSVLVDNICGPPEEIPRDVRLNSTKSVVFSPLPVHDVPLALERFQLPVVTGGAFKLLGSFVGLDVGARAAACVTYVTARLNKLSTLFYSPDVSVQLFAVLLRLCVIPAFAYIARTIPPSIFRGAAEYVDAAVSRFIVSKLGCPELSTRESAYKQIVLPLSLGGFGFTSLRRISLVAFLASTLEFLSSPSRLALADNVPTWRLLSETYDNLFVEMPGAALPIWFLGPHLFRETLAAVTSRAAPLRHVQNILSHALQLREYANLIAVVRAAPQATLHLTRLSLLRRLGRFDWLSVIPSAPSLRLPDRNFISSCRQRLGLSFQPNPPLLCRFCDAPIDHVVDPFHLLACADQHSSFQHRHDQFKLCVANLSRECGFSEHVEYTYDKALTRLPDTFRIDIELHANDVGSLVDVTFLTTCSKAKVDNYEATLLKFPAHFLRLRDDEKIAHYARLATFLHMRLYPLSFDTLGSPGRFCDDFTSLLTSRAVDATIVSPDRAAAFMTSVAARIAIAAQRAVFRLAFAAFAAPALPALPALLASISV